MSVIALAINVFPLSTSWKTSFIAPFKVLAVVDNSSTPIELFILLILAIILASPLGKPLLSPTVSSSPTNVSKVWIAVFKFCNSVFLILLTSLTNPLLASPMAVLFASIWAACSAVAPLCTGCSVK